MSKDLSDITICVENVCIPAHKVVLASYDYFRALHAVALLNPPKA